MKNLINEADACRSNDKRNKPYKWSLDIAIFHHLYLKIPFFIRRVLRRPGRARTLASPDSCAFGSADRSASQALSNAPVGSVHCPAASAPLAQLRVRGAFGQKNPLRTARAAKAIRTMTSVGSLPVLVLVWVAYASPRKAEGFFGLPSRTRSCARGVEVAGVKNAADRRVFQGLQRRLNAAEGALGRRRCEPVARHRNTGKTRSSTCGKASTGVAPR